MLISKRHRPVLVLWLMIVAATAPALAQPGDADSSRAADSGTAVWDRRFRVIGGGALVTGYLNDGLTFPFANVNFRWSSNVSRGSMAPTLGAGVELGTNFFLPYVKAGPEARLGGAFLAAHAGMTLGFFIGGHDASTGLIPFIGAAGGYCFGLQGVGLELESGINTGPYGDQGGAISYLALALAFR